MLTTSLKLSIAASLLLLAACEGASTASTGYGGSVVVNILPDEPVEVAPEEEEVEGEEEESPE